MSKICCAYLKKTLIIQKKAICFKNTAIGIIRSTFGDI